MTELLLQFCQKQLASLRIADYFFVRILDKLILTLFSGSVVARKKKAVKICIKMQSTFASASFYPLAGSQNFVRYLRVYMKSQPRESFCKNFFEFQARPVFKLWIKRQKRCSQQDNLELFEYILALLAFLLCVGLCGAQPSSNRNLAINFDGKYGQLEIGGKYVGAEFHHSRPLPSRISFYYPVANSIDLSTSYWKRAESHPLAVVVTVDGKADTLGREPAKYKYTPFSASFVKTGADYEIEFTYDFCDDVPVMVFRMKLRNLSGKQRDFQVLTTLHTTLRTSHTYAVKNQARVGYSKSGSAALARFDETETDSVLLFVANAGEIPLWTGLNKESAPALPVANPMVHFEYRNKIAPNNEMAVVQLIGCCRQSEGEDVIRRAITGWQQGVQKNTQRVYDSIWQQAKFSVADTVLQQTVNWSKAMLATNSHYLDGRNVPMPCPAEYNFFFTHDLLLTGLGAVLFDLDWIKNGYLFLHSITGADSILPHAYYWKDNGFKTEFCNAGNWNHLWFIISVSAYLKHSADTETADLLFPLIVKSIKMMLDNKGEDGLMYASRPDWWDIGNVYGSRAYITALMIRALRDYVFIASQLGKTDENAGAYLLHAERMQEQLIRKLWDKKSGFLMNMLDSVAADEHYYSGSLVAAWLGVLNGEKRNKLLQTAEEKLLDKRLGIRNAMPADFHEYIDAYKFNGMEMGEPYFYLNGGIWPHGIAWYALGLLANNQPVAAMDVTRKYLSLQGIRNSPNGQPSFFEYRIADPESPRYGEIDKPTFLWAAGWFLNVLYRLAGARENFWNLSFDANLPEALHNPEYDLTLYGNLCRVSWQGEGKYFRRIIVEGEPVNSAVVFSPAQKIVLERGMPETPYLARANCEVEDARYSSSDRLLSIDVIGVPGQKAQLKIISPDSLKSILFDGMRAPMNVALEKDSSVYLCTYQSDLKKTKSTIAFQF